MSNDLGTPRDGQIGSGAQQLEPLNVTGVTIVTIGTVIWAALAVVLFAIRGSLSSEQQDWPWIALAGFVLGLMGIRYTKRRASRVAKGNS